METTIPAWDLVGMLGDDEVVVVDCRPREAWCRLPFQIPGSLHMALDEILHEPSALPDDELIVLVDGADGVLARRAWRALLVAGRTAVCLRGGFRGWLQSGYPTERVGLRVDTTTLHS